MLSRRDALHRSALALAGIALPGGPSAATSHGGRVDRVRGIRPRADRLLRLGGIGDGYKMTLAANGVQFVGVNDGPGWTQPPQRFDVNGLWTIAGPPDAPSFRQVPGYPALDRAARPEDAPSYYGHGLIAIGNQLYQFLSTLDRAADRPRHWTGTKLIHSPDGGRSWRNQDGSAPVRWEDWGEQSRASLAFFDEPDGCFSLLSIVQMGAGYAANRDGFVYLYSVNGSVDGQMNALVLARVPTGSMLDRRAYRFFAGRRRDGSAAWSPAIADRAVVHRFPRGWVNRTNLFPGDLVVESWLPSVAYNPALGLYMMTSAGIGCAPDGTEFGKPSYFGFWVSDVPWGPWRQIHADAAWAPGGEAHARAYAPQIAPGWISRDGRSLWILWADLAGIRAFGRDEALLQAAIERAATPSAKTAAEVDFLHRYMPRFACNAQRIDLLLD